MRTRGGPAVLVAVLAVALAAVLPADSARAHGDLLGTHTPDPRSVEAAAAARTTASRPSCSPGERRRAGCSWSP